MLCASYFSVVADIRRGVLKKQGAACFSGFTARTTLCNCCLFKIKTVWPEIFANIAAACGFLVCRVFKRQVLLCLLLHGWQFGICTDKMPLQIIWLPLQGPSLAFLSATVCKAKKIKQEREGCQSSCCSWWSHHILQLLMLACGQPKQSVQALLQNTLPLS